MLMNSNPLQRIIPSVRDFQAFLTVYFSAINSVYYIADENTLTRKVYLYYNNQGGLESVDEIGEGFEATVCVATALGSLFMDRTSDATLEAALMKRAASLLGGPIPKRRPTKNMTLYYRATTRPGIAYLTSCQAVILCEAVGLHQDYPYSPTREMDRNTFWVIKSINFLIAYENGRSAFQLRHVTCLPIPSIPSFDLTMTSSIALPKSAQLFCNMVSLLPDDESQSIATILDTLYMSIKEASASHAVMPMILADVTFCLYRRMQTSWWNQDNRGGTWPTQYCN